MNDTTVYNMWWDSYPYSCVSVHALHPIYLSLQDMADRLHASVDGRERDQVRREVRVEREGGGKKGRRGEIERDMGESEEGEREKGKGSSSYLNQRKTT